MKKIGIHRPADRLCAAAGGFGNGRVGGLPQDGHQRADVLPLEEEIRRSDAVRSPQAQATAGREHPASSPGGRSEPGQGDAAGGDPKKALKPVLRREIVDHLRAAYEVSIRRACRVLPLSRSSYHYRSCRSEQPAPATTMRTAAQAARMTVRRFLGLGGVLPGPKVFRLRKRILRASLRK